MLFRVWVTIVAVWSMCVVASQTWAAPPNKRSARTKASKDAALSVKVVRQRLEKILRACNAKDFAKALRLMGPVMRKSVSAKLLKQQIALTRATIGTYTPNSLQFLSSVAQFGKTRFIWNGKFQQETGTILMLFNKDAQLMGFIIQSPKLLQRLRKERPIKRLAPALQKKLSAMVEQLLRGYNKGSWKHFCLHCSPLMRLMYRPPRFASMRKILHKQFGAFQRKRFLRAARLSLGELLVLHYHGAFKKQHAALRVVFRKKDALYHIAGWRVSKTTRKR